MRRAPRGQYPAAPRRQQPAAPLPDYRNVFLEPHYTDPDVAAAYQEAWEEEQASRRAGGRASRRRAS